MPNGQECGINFKVQKYFDVNAKFACNLKIIVIKYTPLKVQRRKIRDVAQFGRALPWGGRGREFKSRRSDQLKKLTGLSIFISAVLFS